MIILATEADEDPWRNPGHGSLLCHDKRGRTQPSSSPLRVTQSNDEVASALGLWCRTTGRPNGMVLAREDMRDSIDVLVVNEADQFSLANAGVHPDEQRRDGRVHRIHTAIQTQFTVGGGFELAPACRVHRTERLRRPIDR